MHNCIFCSATSAALVCTTRGRYMLNWSPLSAFSGDVFFAEFHLVIRKNLVSSWLKDHHYAYTNLFSNCWLYYKMYKINTTTVHGSNVMKQTSGNRGNSWYPQLEWRKVISSRALPDFQVHTGIAHQSCVGKYRSYSITPLSLLLTSSLIKALG